MGIRDLETSIVDSNTAICIQNKGFFVNAMTVFPGIPVKKDIMTNRPAVYAEKKMKAEKTAVWIFDSEERVTQYGARPNKWRSEIFGNAITYPGFGTCVEGWKYIAKSYTIMGNKVSTETVLFLCEFL